MTSKRVLESTINLNVGGLYFCLSAEDISRFPDSYFAHLLKDAWNPDKTRVVHLNDRDGEAFRFIHRFLLTGSLNSFDNRTKDLDLLLSLKREADFFNIPEIVPACEKHFCEAYMNWCKNDFFSISSSWISVNAREYGDSCVDPFRTTPKSYWNRLNIATTQLPSREVDRTLCPTVSKFAEMTMSQCRKLKEQKPSTRCEPDLVLDSLCLHHYTWQRIRCSFTKWPLWEQDIQISNKGNVFVFPTGSSCSLIEQLDRQVKFGTILYIFNSEFTGGTVTATSTGGEVSAFISKPCECLAVGPGCTFSVDVVTSGVLIVVELLAQEHKYRDFHIDHLKWVVQCNKTEAEVKERTLLYDRLISCVDGDLNTYTSVVLGLRNYYGYGYSDSDNRLIELGPEYLTGTDKELYDHLVPKYEIDTVTVCTYRVGSCLNNVMGACVLDYITNDHCVMGCGTIADADTSADTTANTTADTTTDTTADTTADNNLDAGHTTTQCKIMAPSYKYGRQFDFMSSIANPESEQPVTVYGAWMTGLVLTKRNSVMP